MSDSPLETLSEVSLEGKRAKLTLRTRWDDEPFQTFYFDKNVKLLLGTSRESYMAQRKAINNAYMGKTVVIGRQSHLSNGEFARAEKTVKVVLVSFCGPKIAIPTEVSWVEGKKYASTSIRNVRIVEG